MTYLLREGCSVIVASRCAARFVAVACLLFAMIAAPTRAQAAPWLFVSDIHLDPGNRDARPVERGKDTNEALFASALAAMRKADPNPPVVFITGDFFAHGFDYRRAPSTMRDIARRFNAAFPHAQFVIALGNEDSPCADYTLTPNSPFLRATAADWAPLVNRNGAAPEFTRTFARDGFYTARLPIHGLRVVVIDDVFWSPRYRPGCGTSGNGGPNETLNDLNAALRPSGAERRWVVLHIPPGIDAYSTTHLTHHLAVVPFLDPNPRYAFMQAVQDRGRHVALVLAAHIHKFSYRVIGADTHDPLPVFLIPSISPIFRNNPSFLTVDVANDGTITDAQQHALVDRRHWETIGSLRALGVERVSGEQLLALQHRLDRNPALLERYASMYNGGAPPEFDEGNWRGYACASVALGATDYRRCLGQGGYSVFTRRGLTVIGFGLAVIAVVIAAVIMFFRRLGVPSR